jgi:hypothetical protein
VDCGDYVTGLAKLRIITSSKHVARWFSPVNSCKNNSLRKEVVAIKLIPLLVVSSKNKVK